MVDYLSNFPPQLAVFIISALPLGELRAAFILVALGVYKLSLPETYFWAVLGNVISVGILLWVLDPLSHFLMNHSRFFNKFFTRLFNKARHKHTGKMQKWGALALVLFVGVPLPLTGGWTGAVIASVFGIPFRRSFPLVSAGVLIAGLIMVLAAKGFISLNLFT